MKSISAVLFFLSLNCCLFAQKTAVKTEIGQSFENYKSSFENANHCMKVIYECFQSAMSVSNAREFATEAEKYASLAKKFAKTAAEEAVEAREVAESNKCQETTSKIDAAQVQFYDAHSVFSAISKQLEQASSTNEMDGISELLMGAMKEIQVGIQHLNDGAAAINGGIKTINNCQ